MRILLVTAPADAADRIARTLVEERLAACVNCVDAVRSVYRWNDAVETADEVQLFVKTSDSLVPALAKRIAERFPRSGLSEVAAELSQVTREALVRAEAIRQPNLALRAGLVAVAVLAAAGLWWLFPSLDEQKTFLNKLYHLLDAAKGGAIYLGAIALFFITLEVRLKRRKALQAVHELRALAHVIDMHQLTKDPTAFGSPRTSSSPNRTMTPFQLLRYLGYCSELLSLASKVAALYADKIRDPAIVDAVGDIERLTAHLSQKIWQKIELIQERLPTRPASDALGPRATHDA